MSYYQHGAAQQSAPPVSYYATPQTPSATAYGQAAVQAAVQASAYGTPTQQPQPYYPQQPANYPPSYGTQGQWAGTYSQVHTGGAASAPTYQYSQAPVQYPQPSSQPNQQQYANQYQPYQQQYPVQASQVGTGFPQQAQPAPGYQAAGAQQYHQASGYYGQSHPYPTPQGVPSEGSFSPLPLPPGARGGGGHRGGFGGYRGDRGGRGGRGSAKRHDGGRSGVMKDDDPRGNMPPRAPQNEPDSSSRADVQFPGGAHRGGIRGSRGDRDSFRGGFHEPRGGYRGDRGYPGGGYGDDRGPRGGRGGFRGGRGGFNDRYDDRMGYRGGPPRRGGYGDRGFGYGHDRRSDFGPQRGRGGHRGGYDGRPAFEKRPYGDRGEYGGGVQKRRRTDDRDHRHLGDYEFDEDMPRSAQRRGRDRGDVVIEDGVEAYYKKSFTEDPWADLLPDEMPVF
ncbi:uncharacterized protein SPPG_02776 [Spizellomyces punctatus DAOM BR117]|uniref:Btz domain-containing protein n=1 Tax=Spizellomyces punctatus (strain DAOM BR117) TaxID=645134 RepID=A0A0L0HMG7_SPIPD|nr:uncharacterized protein SPPG_02776 [Spizellomyces punctatus DAOM BR117]KND02302.1 hypothetical protein SPPG_02776 [Spizellomyces punctatus DAOM BR117]|eukprot:XP_016610341.1 hypothetical protein SPPG_02776 [Spizellomyces punctatus DAOM BR117]